MSKHDKSVRIQSYNYGSLCAQRCTVLAARLLCGLLLLAVSTGDYSNSHLRLSAVARDDGRYANSPLKSWFDSLASKKGACCSFADGLTLTDVQWDISDDGHYKVEIDGQWYPVPDDAVLTVPNKYGQAVVWPYTDWGIDGTKNVKIRCFIPGAGT